MPGPAVLTPIVARRVGLSNNNDIPFMTKAAGIGNLSAVPAKHIPPFGPPRLGEEGKDDPGPAQHRRHDRVRQFGGIRGARQPEAEPPVDDAQDDGGPAVPEM